MPTPAVARHPNQFGSVVSFLNSVRRASEAGGSQVDQRLFAAVTTSSNENVGADGGYLVPPDLSARLSDAMLGETSLLSRCTLIETTKNAVGLPLDPNPGYSTAGAQPSVEIEGGALNQSKLNVALRSMRVCKLSVLLPVTDELLEDGGPELEAGISDIVARKLTYLVNSHLLSGDGLEKSVGWLNSGALVTVAAEGGQTSATINFLNVSHMFSRLLPSARASAVWVVSSSAEEQLRGMVSPVGSPALVYSAGEVYPRLFGLPVLCTEAASAVGVVGDVSLVAMRGIVAAVRPGLVKKQLSTDIWFDQGVGAFRFTLRLGASPLLNAPIAPRAGTNSLTTCVSLAARP
jgi:HK97 family phage major capsid protein